jgi:hypothetical protein
MESARPPRAPCNVSYNRPLSPGMPLPHPIGLIESCDSGARPRHGIFAPEAVIESGTQWSGDFNSLFRERTALP